MTVNVKINKIGARADGVGDLDGVPIYIPFTAPGDVVEAKITERGRFGLSAKLVRVIKPGKAHRQKPQCGHFGDCGGCLLQHVADRDYANWLGARIEMALAKHGIEAPGMRPPVISPPRSRRRTALRAHMHRGQVALGFNRRQSKAIIDIGNCPVLSPVLMRLVPLLREFLTAHVPQSFITGNVRLTEALTGVDCVIDWPEEPGLDALEALADFAKVAGIARLSLEVDRSVETIVTRHPVEMEFSGIRVALPPAAFIQATEEGEAALVAAVMEAAEGATHAVDLFAGLGTFSFALATTAKVSAVEGYQGLVDALKSASEANGLPLRCEHRDLYRRPVNAAGLDEFDLIVIDPPRAGARDQMAEIGKSNVPTVLAISCNPNTFGRDARLMVDGGYEIDWIRPVGQFLWSHHVELAACFRKPRA